MKIESIEHLTKLMNEKPKIGRPKGSYSVKPKDLIDINLTFSVNNLVHDKIINFKKVNKKTFVKVLRAEISKRYDL
jgi:hypothetical protein